MGRGLTAAQPQSWQGPPGGGRRGSQAPGRAEGSRKGARGHRTLTLSWLSAETTGSQSCARQRPPEQTTGWQPRKEVMGLAPPGAQHLGAGPAIRQLPASASPAQVAQGLQQPKLDPPPPRGLTPPCSRGRREE